MADKTYRSVFFEFNFNFIISVNFYAVFLERPAIPFLLILQHSITCHKGVSRTISLWALRRYRSRIWRHRSPDMPVCSSVRSSLVFSPSAILSRKERETPQSRKSQGRISSKGRSLGNRNPIPDCRQRRLPSRHHCGSICPGT